MHNHFYLSDWQTNILKYLVLNGELKEALLFTLYGMLAYWYHLERGKGERIWRYQSKF